MNLQMSLHVRAMAGGRNKMRARANGLQGVCARMQHLSQRAGQRASRCDTGCLVLHGCRLQHGCSRVQLRAAVVAAGGSTARTHAYLLLMLLSSGGSVLRCASWHCCFTL